jgi:YD repeat-containing protein
MLKMTLLAMTALASTIASANVTLKNGNFFLGYTDLSYSGGFEPKIERVYNSKSPHNGVFGWGWGNEYEVFLTVSADGSVVVNEYGAGAKNRFNPAAFDAAELQAAVDRLAQANSAALSSPALMAQYKQKLSSDATFRNDEWERLKRSGRVKAREVAVGTKLYSTKYSYQFITRSKDGYFRAFESGRLERFDEAGRLTRVSDKNNNFIELSYGKDGKPNKIVDNFNRKIFLTFNSQGKVEKIQGENGKESTYRYNELGELISARDSDGNTYQYKYSSDRRHNLVEVAYADKTTLQVSYWGRDLSENVKRVKDRDGTVTEYSYDRKPAEGLIGIAVAIKTKEGKEVSKSRYDYTTKRKANGEEWTYRLVSTVDGEKTDTIYNECCGLPLIIKKDGEETTFSYNERGNVTKKVTPTDVTEITYDAKSGKVARVAEYPKTGKKEVQWSQFQYDEKDNLTFAQNSDKKAVRLFYDSNGRIRSMVDHKRKRVDFKYNEQSKPIEITDPSLGTITVQYTNSGEVKQVDSTAGRKIAAEVSGSFQNLLEIIRPAGVSLSF